MSGSIPPLQSTAPESSTRTGPVPVSEQSALGSGTSTILLSPMPDVDPSILYENMQSLRVAPGSVPGLESIVGCAKGKDVIESIIEATIERPFLAKLGRMVKGVLFYGPLGTGKTAMVLAAASSRPAGPTVYMVTTAAIYDAYHGGSERNVAALYDAAARNAPAIVFIDEADALCRKRNYLSDFEWNIRLALLTAMRNSPSNVVTICATSLPWDIDHVFLKQLECHIYVPLPSIEELTELWRLKLSKWPHCISEQEFIMLGRETHGFSGRQVESAARGAMLETEADKIMSMTHYRRVEYRGQKYICHCLAEHPAAQAINGDAGILANIQGRPTSYQDLQPVIAEMMPAVSEAHEAEKRYIEWAKKSLNR